MVWRKDDQFGHKGQIRRELRHLHNGNDIIVSLACHQNAGFNFTHEDKWCMEHKRNYSKYDYHSLLSHSTFALVPPGWGLHTMRLLESMSVGCIPVIIADGWVLPFHEVLDWSQFSIRVPEAEWDTIPALLRMVPPPLIEEMQRKVVHVYNTYFRSKRDVLNVALGIVEAKLCPPQNHCE